MRRKVCLSFAFIDDKFDVLVMLVGVHLQSGTGDPGINKALKPYSIHHE